MYAPPPPQLPPSGRSTQVLGVVGWDDTGDTGLVGGRTSVGPEEGVGGQVEVEDCADAGVGEDTICTSAQPVHI